MLLSTNLLPHFFDIEQQQRKANHAEERRSSPGSPLLVLDSNPKSMLWLQYYYS